MSRGRTACGKARRVRDQRRAEPLADLSALTCPRCGAGAGAYHQAQAHGVALAVVGPGLLALRCLVCGRASEPVAYAPSGGQEALRRAAAEARARWILTTDTTDTTKKERKP